MKNILMTLVIFLLAPTVFAADPLPSWNESAAKKSIITFVEKATNEKSPNFVPVPERIAVFDNDGTLWAEQPLYFQFFFALDRVKALAPQHPEWKNQEPFASLLKGDTKGALAGGDKALLDIVMATHAGMTTTEFEKVVTDWIATAKHPVTQRPYTEMVYQPMLELLAYLRANGFKTYIVSGGGIEFMRPWTERVYGIPPEQVVGSSGGLKYELRDGQPIIVKMPELVLNDDKDGKPVGIQRHIGRKPIAAFGNSDGDLQMLQWTCIDQPNSFCLYVHHTDNKREWAYDRESHIGKFDKGLDEAQARKWTVVDMKSDWKQVYPSPEIMAIDILLEPDATMLKHSADNNARLLKVFPKGFALDEAHTPHITMLQCFVPTADLDKLYAALEKVLAAAKVNALKLEAFKFYYAPAGETGIAGISAIPTADILELQANIIAAAKPFMVKTAAIDAFTAPHDVPKMDTMLIDYVSTFVPKMSGENFNPHVSTGVAPKEYLDKMIAEPFNSFTFSPVGAAVYQLGPYGTAAKKLKQLQVK